MAHYAFLNQENFVVEVITGKDENEILDGLTPEEWYGSYRGQVCIRTSYNENTRKNFASVGFYYDASLDAFIAPKCHDEAILDEDSCKWICGNEDHDVIS